MLAILFLLVSAPIAAAQSPAARARALVGRMNQTEKLTLVNGVWGLGWGPPSHPYVGNIHGIPRVGVPFLSLQDGPQGYRDGKYGHYPGAPGTSTQWPSGLTVSATWDRRLAGEWGTAMGAEFKAKGANCQLGPGLNVARVPGGGRNFEYMSGEDPFLGAEMVAPVVKGIQSNGVIATAKHYIMNNQEEQRGNMSANVDERTLVEVYLAPFASAVKAGVGSLMCGYNKINNVWACESKHTLGALLKKELGFEGFVMSDWGATHSAGAAVLAGLDQEMPGGTWYTPEKLKADISNGTITQGDLDGMAVRVLTSMFAVGIMDTPQPTGVPSANATSEVHAALALEIAQRAAVLLKNERAVLPLQPAASVAVVGLAANCEAPTPNFGFGWPPTIGCLNSGGGSGNVWAAGVESILSAVKRRSSGTVTYANGTDTAAAAAAAKASDAAIVVVGSTSSEGTDRASIALIPRQVAYLKAVAAAQPNVVVVVMAPGATIMDWERDVPAVACFFLPGQGQGQAVASVLYGDVNPSGRLPITMPRVENEMQFTEEQYPGIAHADGLQTNYSEKLLVGYRWYAAHDVKPAFSFGHGLSYTKFDYSNITVSPTKDGRVVEVTVSNTGERAGAEVAQMYLSFPASSGEPPLQLKGFQKLPVPVGGTVRMSFPLTSRDLSVWDANTHAWREEHGEFEVKVGGASDLLPLSAKFVN